MPYRTIATPAGSVHECWPTALGRYHMPGSWIDTDNRVFEEPVHLYTTHCAGLPSHAAPSHPHTT